MEAFLATAGLLFVGAITPGPNNVIVLHAASRGGVSRALRAIVAIVLGLLVLLALVLLGVGTLLQAHPGLALWVTVAGCVFLSGMGLRLMTQAQREPAPHSAHSDRAGMWGILIFQFLNPKAWLLALLATSATQSTHGLRTTFLLLAPLFVIIPASCLLLWSALGVGLTRFLQRRRARQWFDRFMGSALIGFAALLLVHQLGRN